MSCTCPTTGQRLTSNAAREDLPAPLPPSMRTTGFAAATARTSCSISAAACSRAAATGSSLLEGTDDASERPSGDPDEGDSDHEQRDDVGLEAQTLLATHVHADRNGDATAAATLAAVAAAATETGV